MIATYAVTVLIFWTALQVLSFPLIVYLDGDLPEYPAHPSYRMMQYIIDLSESNAQERIGSFHQKFLSLSQENPNIAYTPDYYTIGRTGEYLPKHPLLATWIAVPFYQVMGDAGIRLLIAGLLAGLIIFPLFLIHSRAGDLFVFNSLAVLVSIMLGTKLVQTFATQYSYDVLGTVMLLLGCYLMCKHPLFAGILIGLSLSCRITNVFWFVPLFLIFKPMQHWKSGFQPYWIGLCIGGLPVLAMNGWFYGHPVTAGYQNAPVYLNGQITDTMESISFSYRTLLEQFSDRLFKSPQSLWSFYPAMLLAIPLLSYELLRRGCGGQRKLDVPLLLLLSSSILFIALFISFSYWQLSGGTRFVMFPAVLLITTGVLVLIRLLQRLQLSQKRTK
ncbi:MAG: hypothetical protein AAF649_06185 [Verrucomicrobiota bacterium]